MKWYKSKITIGIVVTAVVGLLALFNIDVDPEKQGIIQDILMAIGLILG